MSDPDAKFSKQIGWTKGERTSRYAMIVDHGKIAYAENEPGGDVTVSQRHSVRDKEEAHKSAIGVRSWSSACEVVTLSKDSM